MITKKLSSMNKYPSFRQILRNLEAVLVVFLLMFLGLPPLISKSAQAGQETWSLQRHDLTNFPLTGMHRTIACRECHLDGVIGGTPTQCEDCHWNRKNDDPYNLKLGINCRDCHSSTSWNKINPGAWNHLKETGFLLSGQHGILECLNCHKSTNFTGQNRDCFSCHEKDYLEEDEPDHQQAGYSTDCLPCHGDSAATWEGASFDHNQYWSLKGSHAGLECLRCHADGYTNTVSDCIACHQTDFNETTNPNHQQAGYSTDCLPCHGDSAATWEGASFDHNQYWSLKGSHTELECIRCHADGYAGTPSDCNGCHASDYDNSSDPNHLSAGFPRDCVQCHSADHVSWSQGTFFHAFPLTTGDHRNLSCVECHNTSNYKDFTCIDCHEHSQSETDDEHKGVSGYSYSTLACYSCHPQGKE